MPANGLESVFSRVSISTAFSLTNENSDDADQLIAEHSNGVKGRVDTQALASHLHSMAQRDMPAAQKLYAEINANLEANASPMEAAHFRLDVAAKLNIQQSAKDSTIATASDTIPAPDNTSIASAPGQPQEAKDPASHTGFGVDDGVSLALDMMPVVGTGKAVVELVIGRDPITGDPIPRWQSAVGIVAGMIPGGKAAVKGGLEIVEQVAQHGDEVLEASAKILGETVGSSKRIENATDVSRMENVKSYAPPTKADLDSLRAKYNLPSTPTLGIGKTNIPGLENEVFEGISPGLRRKANPELKQLDEILPNRRIQSPFPSSQFSKHAEEDIFNQVDQRIIQLGLKESDLKGKTLEIHIDNPRGVCNKCTFGLMDEDAPKAGVVRRMSELYPSLTIKITSEGGPAMKRGQGLSDLQTLIVRNGKIIEE